MTKRDDVRAARVLVAASSAIVAGGLAISATGNQSLGGVVLLAGWIGFILALHRFGRTGVG